MAHREVTFRGLSLFSRVEILSENGSSRGVGGVVAGPGHPGEHLPQQRRASQCASDAAPSFRVTDSREASQGVSELHREPSEWRPQVHALAAGLLDNRRERLTRDVQAGWREKQGHP